MEKRTEQDLFEAHREAWRNLGRALLATAPGRALVRITGALNDWLERHPHVVRASELVPPLWVVGALYMALGLAACVYLLVT